jgi:flagellar hook protein FlgE
MALIQSLGIGVSGLRAQQKKVEITGNNIANVSTTAFKEGRALFHTLFSQVISYGSAPSGTLGGIDPVQYGLGVQLSDTNCKWTQGALSASGVKSDLAIDGDGFFVLTDEAGAKVYSRDGSFTLNQSNYLHNPANGYLVQGYGIDADFRIKTGASLENIRIPLGVLTIAQATRNAVLEGNLNTAGSVATSGTRLNSETLYDVRTMVGGNPMTMTAADAATPLEFIARIVNGSSSMVFTNLQTGDTIDLALQKGARELPERTFTYGDPPPTGGTTLGELMSFLQGASGINIGTWDGREQTEDTYSFARRDPATSEEVNGTLGAAMTSAGTLTIAGENWAAKGVQVGDFLVFTSGAASGQTAEILGIAGDTLTLRTDGFNSLEVLATTGDTYSVHAPAGVNISNGQIQIAGNVGESNGISNVEFMLNGSRVILFNSPPAETATGESIVTTLTVYDSLGAPHQVDVTFVYKASETNGPNTFSWTAESADDTDRNRVVGSGTLLFDADGQYLGTGPRSTDVSIDIRSAPGSSAGVTTPFIFNPDFSRMTDFGGQDGDVVMTSQDGIECGVLQDYAISSDGIIQGIFSNGLTRNLGQIVLARFANNNGLIQDGQNNWRSSVNSGIAVIGEPATGARGIVRSGFLEESNVDLAEQFTELIVGQRAFQANAKTITVSDQMLQELVNLI